MVRPSLISFFASSSQPGPLKSNSLVLVFLLGRIADAVPRDVTFHTFDPKTQTGTHC
jgi:hypothetical protein